MEEGGTDAHSRFLGTSPLFFKREQPYLHFGGGICSIHSLRFTFCATSANLLMVSWLPAEVRLLGYNFCQLPVKQEQLHELPEGSGYDLTFLYKTSTEMNKPQHFTLRHPYICF